MGDLLRLPIVEQRSCFECQHALFGVSGTYCRLYHIDVWDEQQEANGCEEYAP